MRLFSSLLVAAPALAASVDVAFDVKQHLGNLSPQFTPSFGLAGGLGTGMPSDCSLEQVQLVSPVSYRDVIRILVTCKLTVILAAPAWVSFPFDKRTPVHRQPFDEAEYSEHCEAG